MELGKLQYILDSKVSDIREFIKAEIPPTGLKESDCQQLCLLNRLNEFERAVVGITKSDLIQDQLD